MTESINYLTKPAHSFRGLIGNFYAKSVDFARKYIPINLIDAAEMAIPFVSSAMAFHAVFVSLPSRLLEKDAQLPAWDELNVAFLGTIIGIHNLLKYNLSVKLPYIQNRMKRITGSSQSACKSLLAFSGVGNPRSLYDQATVFHAQVDLFEKLAKTHSIEILDGSRESIEKKMHENQKKYDMIFINHHGNEKKIRICPDFEISMTSEKILRWFNAHIKDRGMIVLGSCNSGDGDDNIARQFSIFCPNALIVASSSAVHSATGTEFNEHSFPSFNNGRFFKGQDTTRIYQNGALKAKKENLA